MSQMRTKLPEIIQTEDDAKMRMAGAAAKHKMEEYANEKSQVQECGSKMGDTVLRRNIDRRIGKLKPYYQPKPFIVTHKKCSMITARTSDRVVTRNSSFFKLVNVLEPSVDAEEVDWDFNVILDANARERALAWPSSATAEQTRNLPRYPRRSMESSTTDTIQGRH